MISKKTNKELWIFIKTLRLWIEIIEHFFNFFGTNFVHYYRCEGTKANKVSSEVFCLVYFVMWYLHAKKSKKFCFSLLLSLNLPPKVQRSVSSSGSRSEVYYMWRTFLIESHNFFRVRILKGQKGHNCRKNFRIPFLNKFFKRTTELDSLRQGPNDSSYFQEDFSIE